MTVLKEIHAQPAWVRMSLFVLSCVTVLSVAGYVWLTSVQRNVIMALDPIKGPERVAQLEQSRPDPLNGVRKGFGSAAASIGNFIGMDPNEGFDTASKKGDDEDRVYLLPLSE